MIIFIGAVFCIGIIWLVVELRNAQETNEYDDDKPF